MRVVFQVGLLRSLNTFFTFLLNHRVRGLPLFQKVSHSRLSAQRGGNLSDKIGVVTAWNSGYLASFHRNACSALAFANTRPFFQVTYTEEVGSLGNSPFHRN